MNKGGLRGIVPAIVGFYVFILYAPVLLLPLFSFSDSIYMTFPIRNWTVKWYEKMIEEEALIRSLWASIKIALGASVASTVIGFMSAKALTRYNMRGKAYVLALFMVPLVVPPMILGGALLTFLRQFLDMELSLWTVSLSHILICIPFSLLVILAQLEGFDRSLEEASYDLGMSSWQTLRRVTLPLAMPGVLASLLLCFMISFDEFMLAFFLTGNQATLPVYMYSLLRFPDALPTVLALGSCVLVVSVALVAIAEWLRGANDKKFKMKTHHERV